MNYKDRRPLTQWQINKLDKLQKVDNIHYWEIMKELSDKHYCDIDFWIAIGVLNEIS